MGTGIIASDIGAANAAITGLTSVSISQGQQVNLGKSNITSMTTGTTVNNHLLTDLDQLVKCVQQQSKKFPKIAENFELQDRQTAQNLRGL